MGRCDPTRRRRRERVPSLAGFEGKREAETLCQFHMVFRVSFACGPVMCCRSFPSFEKVLNYFEYHGPWWVESRGRVVVRVGQSPVLSLAGD